MSTELAGFHIEGLEDESRVDGTGESSRQRPSNREREGMPDHLTTEEKGIIAVLARVDTSTSHPVERPVTKTVFMALIGGGALARKTLR